MLRDYMELVYEKKFHELKYHNTYTLLYYDCSLDCRPTVAFPGWG
jgi:hypothetical protein